MTFGEGPLQPPDGEQRQTDQQPQPQQVNLDSIPGLSNFQPGSTGAQTFVGPEVMTGSGGSTGGAEGGPGIPFAAGRPFVYQFPIDISLPLLERKPRASDRAVAKLKRLDLDEIPLTDRACPICFDPYVKLDPTQDFPQEAGSSNHADSTSNVEQNNSIPELDLTAEDGNDPPESVPDSNAMDSDPPESVPAATGSDATATSDVHSPVEMPCGHKFGLTCIKEWLSSSNTCPMCRTAIESQDDYLHSIGQAPETGNIVSNLLDAVMGFVPHILSSGFGQTWDGNAEQQRAAQAQAQPQAQSESESESQHQNQLPTSSTSAESASPTPQPFTEGRNPAERITHLGRFSYFVPLSANDAAGTNIRDSIDRTLSIISGLQGGNAHPASQPNSDETGASSNVPANATPSQPEVPATATTPNETAAPSANDRSNLRNLMSGSLLSAIFRRHRARWSRAAADDRNNSAETLANPAPGAESSSSSSTTSGSPTSVTAPPVNSTQGSGETPTESAADPSQTGSLPAAAPPPRSVSGMLRHRRQPNQSSRHHPYRIDTPRPAASDSQSLDQIDELQCASVSNLCIAENHSDGTSLPTLRLDCGHGYHESCLRMYMRAHGDQEIPNLTGGIEDGATREVWCMRCRRYRNVTNHA